MRTVKTHTTEETQKEAGIFASSLKGGEIIALNGELGAGKTTFSQGIAKALGVKKNVNSPTFVIMKIYPVDNPSSNIKQLVHIDAYRLESSADLETIGAIEYFGRKDTIVLIEWAENITKILPEKTIQIDFEAKGEERVIRFKK